MSSLIQIIVSFLLQYFWSFWLNWTLPYHEIKWILQELISLKMLSNTLHNLVWNGLISLCLMPSKILPNKSLPICFLIVLNLMLISFYERPQGPEMISQGSAGKLFAIILPLMVAHEYKRGQKNTTMEGSVTFRMSA